MRAPVWSGQFKRDLKAARKRGKDMEKIKALMRLLIHEKPLSFKQTGPQVRSRNSQNPAGYGLQPVVHE